MNKIIIAEPETETVIIKCPKSNNNNGYMCKNRQNEIIESH